jgi:hypothetical protein
VLCHCNKSIVMQYDCHVTMEMQQTHCHATVPVALLWKCYKDLTCHNTLESQHVSVLLNHLQVHLSTKTHQLSRNR